MRVLFFIPIVLAGCVTMEPQQMARQSNWDVCRFTMGGPHAQVAESERQRRSLDCTPLYPSIIANRAVQDAAYQNYLRATRPAPAAAPVQCTSMRVGNTVQTTCN